MNNLKHGVDADWLNRNMVGRPADVQGLLIAHALLRTRLGPDGIAQADILETLDRMLRGCRTITPNPKEPDHD